MSEVEEVTKKPRSVDDTVGDPHQIVTGGYATVGRYGVIGDPVAHSRSPELHNRWFEEAEIPGSYERVLVSPEDLIRRGPSLPFEFAGLNITAPHKVDILGYVDRVDESAQEAGAANVLYRDEDKAWTAGNTDGEGFVRAIEEALGETIMAKDVVLVGAGGAARAVGARLVRGGVSSLTLINRSADKAARLCREVGGTGSLALLPDALDRLELSLDLLINCAAPAADDKLMGLDLSCLAPHAVVMDINYHKEDPVLLRRASDQGLFVVDGRSMFLWQAALTFEYWTGIVPDFDLGRSLLGMD